MSIRLVNRTLNLGERVRWRVRRRTRATGRSFAAELRYLTGVGLLQIQSGLRTIEGLRAMEPGAEPRGRDFRTGLRAPPRFWASLETLVAACGWLRTPADRASKGVIGFLHGLPSHLSRALRLAVLAGLRAIAEDPSLDTAPAERRARQAVLEARYGSWQAAADATDFCVYLTEDFDLR